MTTAISEERPDRAAEGARPWPEIIIMRTDGTFVGPRSASPGGRTIISLRDGLDLTAAPVLREQLIDVLHHATDLLILDLAHVSACDASGLAVLVGTERRARLLGITMRLVAPSGPVREALRSTGLGRSFAIYPDVAGALAAERPEPAGSALAVALPRQRGVVLPGPWTA